MVSMTKTYHKLVESTRGLVVGLGEEHVLPPMACIARREGDRGVRHTVRQMGFMCGLSGTSPHSVLLGRPCLEELAR